jgi:hypothetical protein
MNSTPEHALVDHVLHGIAASAPDADNLDHGAAGTVDHVDFHDAPP